jgi:hypothetical protein
LGLSHEELNEFLTSAILDGRSIRSGSESRDNSESIRLPQFLQKRWIVARSEFPAVSHFSLKKEHSVLGWSAQLTWHFSDGGRKSAIEGTINVQGGESPIDRHQSN